MCGICGIMKRPGAEPPRRRDVARMIAALGHRGPDEAGLYRDHRTALGHTRLSIIDLAAGQQPLSNEDDSLWITFNGEVFNYVELAEELVALGHRFRTKSDTEVIVHAYEQWGDDAFERMNGQWALALWDARKERLVLSRDRLGVRPLYLCVHEGTLYFASEVKALFAADAAIPRRIDPVGLEQTLTFWSVVPPQSIFAGVEELRPGHVRVYEGGTVTEHAYWEPEYPARESGEGRFRGSIEDATEAVQEAIARAVRLRMVRADVPVGSYLSGGLDSSFVAALGRRFAGGRFDTFSIRFDDDEFDEGEFQRMMADRLESRHHEIRVRGEDIARAFPGVVWHAERPILRTAPAPLWLLSRLVRESGIKVVLTGEGADEVFAGYDLFREGKVRRFWAREPASTLRPRLLERLYPYLGRSPVSAATGKAFFGRRLDESLEPGFAHTTRWDSTRALLRLLSPETRDSLGARDVVGEFLDGVPEHFSSWTPLAQDQHLEMKGLLAGYLLSSQGDRMLMAHSVEGRFPFLDRDVVALASSLPDAYKLAVLDEKHVVKRAASRLVPRAIVERKKQPYRAPDAAAFVGRGAEYVDDLLSESALADSGLFAPAPVRRLWEKCRATPRAARASNTDNMGLVGVISTQLLHQQFVRARPSLGEGVALRTDIDRLESPE
ncbi:MAG TPA: asparagine synthase (glutamine-hydrolyzing) [Polyangiaceae bacterium]|nr:asparagine synthase (glutamine-hydrolyzing) [Polyangiaceae bacterium]